MRTFCDIIFIIVSTLITIHTYYLLTAKKKLSIASYVIMLCYLFNCFPVLCDYIFGYPQYPFYMDKFEKALQNDAVAVIYDFYILLSMSIFYQYYRLLSHKNKEVSPVLIAYDKRNNRVQMLLILLPVAVFLIFVNKSELLWNPAGAGLTLNGSIRYFIGQLLTVSIYCYCCKTFGDNRKKLSLISMLVYIMIVYIVNGKRYVVATVLFSYFFCYMYSRFGLRKNNHINRWLILAVLSLFIFSAYYVTNIKVISSNSFDSLYYQFRVDFGRDDVVKMTILSELKGDHILEYRGQSFLSLLLMIIPRTLWPSKPYPHYRYLTAYLYDATPTTINAGMTPSIFEMMLSNFSFLGIILTPIFLMWIICYADKTRNGNRKFLAMLVLIVLLSQSMDSLLIIFYIFLFQFIFAKCKIKLSKFYFVWEQ